jgi:DNA-binding transcriptional LysR family regulator
MKLDWNHLEFFRVTGRLQHVTRAAEQLGMSQPALSRALAQLERTLGVPVLERAGRSIRLTRHGETFLRRIERAHADIEEARLELADVAGSHRGAVALGFMRTLGADYVPNVVRRFTLRFPGVRFTFIQNNSDMLTDLLLKGEADLIFTAVPAVHPKLSWSQTAHQNLVLIVPKDHPLARRRTVALRDMAAEKFVSFKPEHAMRRLTDDLCQQAGFTPSFSFEGDDSSSVPGFVAAGFGVAIVPPEAGRFPGVVSLTISRPSVRRAIGMAWVEDRFLSASARSFRDFAIAQAVPREQKSQQKRRG